MPVPSLLDTQLRHGGSFATDAKSAIQKALDDASGVIPVAAEALKVSTRTLFRLIDRTGLTDYAAKLRLRAGVSRIGRGPKWLRKKKEEKKRARIAAMTLIEREALAQRAEKQAEARAQKLLEEESSMTSMSHKKSAKKPVKKRAKRKAGVEA